jgi:hypothetical protein
MIAIGAIAERGRLGPMMVFVFLWATLVYDVIACWTWNPHGWSYVMGGLDFAGGTPVHISSGTAALAISIYLGKRRGYGTERLAYKPNNTSFVILGTVFLWFGWFGFNGGSALSANLRAINACIVTNLAASVGGLTWMIWVRLLSSPSCALLTLARVCRITASSASGPRWAFAQVPFAVSWPSPQGLVSSVHVSTASSSSLSRVSPLTCFSPNSGRCVLRRCRRHRMQLCHSAEIHPQIRRYPRCTSLPPFFFPT